VHSSASLRTREQESAKMRHAPSSGRLSGTSEGEQDDTQAIHGRAPVQGREDLGRLDSARVTQPPAGPQSGGRAQVREEFVRRDSPRTIPGQPAPQTGAKRRRAAEESRGTVEYYGRDSERDSGKRARGNHGPHAHTSVGSRDDRRQDFDRPREEDRRREMDRRRDEDRRRQEDRWKEEDRRRLDDRRREESMQRDRRDDRGPRGGGRGRR